MTAKYTIELKTLMEDGNAQGYLNKALSTYPMYQPQSTDPEVLAIIPTREVLNQKLLNHYKYREIGFETIGRFLEELEFTMCEIMPYYNQMYKSVEIMALIDDPFGNVDVTETSTDTRTAMVESSDTGTVNANASDSSSTNSSVNSTHKNVESETAQNKQAQISKDIDNVEHADKVVWTKNGSEDTANTSGESSSNTTSANDSESRTEETVTHTYTKKGNQGVNTYAHDMVEFRTSIIDVTTQILNDKRIKELFMQVF